MFGSQGGNISFPRWEFLLPLMGKAKELFSQQEASDIKKEQSFSKNPSSLPSISQNAFK
jgi:hypothetical protein